MSRPAFLMALLRCLTLLLAFQAAIFAGQVSTAPAVFRSSASSVDSAAGSAADGDRFSGSPDKAWIGSDRAGDWFWEIDFPSAQRVGAILQIHGSHDFVLTNAPASFVWMTSENGRHWREVSGSGIASETRLHRIIRFSEPVRASRWRLKISAVHGTRPVLREIEFYENSDDPVSFPPWVALVNSTHEPAVPNHGREFLPLVRSVHGWAGTPAQQVWVNDFTPEWLNVEPRPIAAFLSGSFKDWCEVDRRTWRGTERVLAAASLPIWASCGGAQALAILAETGTAKPWDCPHCRNSKQPLLPIYTHIGHTAQKSCGDYSGCEFERGPHRIQVERPDPVFAGLGDEFIAMESHCGQIEWAPHGWQRVATAGAGTRTLTQCLRLQRAPIYAAQFHIEMAGTPESSLRIMSNFLAIARNWTSVKRAGIAVPVASD